MKKLKPCPFCGGEAHVAEYEPHKPPDIPKKRRRHFAVRCGKCGLPFGADYYYGGVFQTEDDAASAWNTRADTVETARCVVAADGSVTCSECGMPFVMTGARFCPMCGARLLDLIVTSEAPDGTETVKVITEEQIRKSRGAFESGQKTIFIPRIKTAGDDGEDVT